MDRLTQLPPALSIKQPWVDLILAGEKTIEVREWPIRRRGAILVHASGRIDWKTVELLGYDNVLELPRGGLVAIAEIREVVEFNRLTWLRTMARHRVIHPPVREPVYAVMLGDVIRLPRRIPCRGRSMLFPVPPHVETRARGELAALGLIESAG